jgi:hypothetical protein
LKPSRWAYSRQATLSANGGAFGSHVCKTASSEEQMVKRKRMRDLNFFSWRNYLKEFVPLLFR